MKTKRKIPLTPEHIFSSCVSWVLRLKLQLKQTGDKVVELKNKKMQSKANFKNSISALTRETKGTYPNSHPKAHQKSKPNPNPIQSQSKANDCNYTYYR